MEKTDEQIIADYLGGDENSLSFLIGRHLKPIYNFAFRITGSESEAEDVTQETFMKMWRNLHKYNSSKKFKTWLFAIARNTAIDYVRKQKHFVFSDFDREDGGNFIEETIADPELLPDELAEKIENIKVFDELLKSLDPLYREVLILYYSEEFTFNEISQILNRPMDTVKSQHRRALLKLRKLIENAPK